MLLRSQETGTELAKCGHSIGGGAAERLPADVSTTPASAGTAAASAWLLHASGLQPQLTLSMGFYDESDDEDWSREDLDALEKHAQPQARVRVTPS